MLFGFNKLLKASCLAAEPNNEKTWLEKIYNVIKLTIVRMLLDQVNQ
jgi:hypothetical protein